MIELRRITYTYEHQRPALRDISLSIAPGEWVALVGPAGAGKSTLCRLLCGTLQASADGVLQGKYVLEGRNMTAMPLRAFAGLVGAVFQDPENGLVMDTVVDELAFGPENLRVAPGEIDRRIDEALAEVGMPHARDAETRQLSGGQMQRIAIASMLTMKPRVFVFDDAEANLDAPAREQLVKTLQALHRQGHTIIAAAPRLSGAALAAERAIVLDRGRAVLEGAPAELLSAHRDKLIELGCLPGEAPRSMAGTGPVRAAWPDASGTDSAVLQADRITFGYKGKPPVFRDLSFTLYAGDVIAVLGPNGAGKTTLGKLLAGLLRPTSGTIRFQGRPLNTAAIRAGYVFQQPDVQFIADTVYEEIACSMPDGGRSAAEQLITRFGLTARRHLNPYQLAVSEKRLVNLASAIAADPDLLILDEITAGLDYRTANKLIARVYEYAQTGKIVLFITHDHDLIRSWGMQRIELRGGP